MTGFNMPPGCSPSDIPGNRPEDLAYEAAWEWAEEQLRELTLQEFRRAVLIGKAAVLAEQAIIVEMFKAERQEGHFDKANEIESLQAFKRSVEEALNQGDGSYRP